MPTMPGQALQEHSTCFLSLLSKHWGNAPTTWMGWFQTWQIMATSPEVRQMATCCGAKAVCIAIAVAAVGDVG